MGPGSVVDLPASEATIKLKLIRGGTLMLSDQ